MYNHTYQALIDKLDEFIRKYYRNQLIRGLIYTVTLILFFYIAVISLEYYAHFNTLVRSILFYSFVFTNAYILGKLVIIPLFKLNRLGKIISHEQAAEIIGKHFREIQDKLLNVLQLKKQAEEDSNILIEASINQKIKELKLIPFTAAIDISQNKKYLKYALIPILIIGFVLFSAPSIITLGTKRLVKHGTYFEKEAPFQFVIKNDELRAVEQQDFQLDVKITGNEIPQQVFIHIEDNEYQLTKENIVSFNYLFRNIQKNIRFRLSADGYTSREYELAALPNPMLLDFNISLSYPKYTGKRNEEVKNTGDLIIPAGTKVSWKFNTRNTNVLRMNFNDTGLVLSPSDENSYYYTSVFLNSKNYTVATSNEYFKNKDSVTYAINVIPDLYPAIRIDERKDTLSSQRFYFNGELKDDYGFNKLTFNYRFINKNDTSGQTRSEEKTEKMIPVNKSLTQDQFFYSWDISQLSVSAGDKIKYYFEVWDNDAVNGSKSTRSQSMIFSAPSLKEIAENTEKNNTKIKDDLKESINQAKELQKELNDIHKKVLEKKTLNWEEKKKIESMLEKQKELEKKVESIKNENTKNNTQQSEFKQVDESIVEKQKQLEELFKNIMTDEMKEMFKELEKMLDKLDKNKVQETLEKMKMSNKDIEKELDRTLEIFKQLEFQQKLAENIENLKELSEKQDKQAEKSLDKNADNKQQLEKQQELNKEFESIKKDIEALEKKNQELQHPNNMQNTNPQQQEIQQEMNKSSEQLQENKNKKAAQSQKNAAQKMKELSQQLSSMQSEMDSQNQEEDIKSLRDILENLLQLSFGQEAVMNEVSKTQIDNPQYVKLTQRQKKLQNDSKMIEDSLLSLSKRVPEIQSTINREINEINMNMGKAVYALAERQTAEANNRQQYTMTSVNNLALLLSEVLDQLQQQMKNKMPGQGSCSKPGGQGQKTSMANLRQLQEKLNQQLQQLKDGMEKGKGDQKDGKKSGGGSQGMSEELAKLAAQQAAIRQELQKAADQLNKDGKGGGNLGKLAEKMEDTETDLVNKMISQETLKRQQEILTRLLESEKAEREREMDEKRESNEAKNENFSNPAEFLEYKRLKLKEAELLKTIPPSLNPFYKNKVNEYFNTFEE